MSAQLLPEVVLLGAHVLRAQHLAREVSDPFEPAGVIAAAVARARLGVPGVLQRPAEAGNGVVGVLTLMSLLSWSVHRDPEAVEEPLVVVVAAGSQADAPLPGVAVEHPGHRHGERPLAAELLEHALQPRAAEVDDRGA